MPRLHGSGAGPLGGLVGGQDPESVFPRNPLRVRSKPYALQRGSMIFAGLARTGFTERGVDAAPP